MDKSKWSVHEGHCCVLHGCKYGDEDCPVVSGETQQLYLCESCGYDEIGSLEVLKAKVGYKYFLYLLEYKGKYYGDYIEGEGADPESFWIGCDFSVAKEFDTAEAAHSYAFENGLKCGEYAIHGFYLNRGKS